MIDRWEHFQQYHSFTGSVSTMKLINSNVAFVFFFGMANKLNSYQIFTDFYSAIIYQL
jgi:hypothetical protein